MTLAKIKILLITFMLVLFIACGNNNSLNPANPVEVEEIKITEEPQNNAKDSNNNDIETPSSNSSLEESFLKKIN